MTVTEPSTPTPNTESAPPLLRRPAVGLVAALLACCQLGACRGPGEAPPPGSGPPGRPVAAADLPPSARYGASHARSDPRAIALAEKVLERLGGRQSWEETRYVCWSFFGRRRHVWDRWTGDVRIETSDGLVLMNVDTRKGRAWEQGAEIQDPAALAERLSEAHQWWINDSYWMFMPYKLLDPGVVLAYVGPETLPDGRASEVLQLTFEDVGYTPANVYHVRIAEDTGLVAEWSFWPDAGELDGEPAFTLPWRGWTRFGDIWLATGHGRGADWDVAVPAELPRSLFTQPLGGVQPSDAGARKPAGKGAGAREARS